MNKVGNKVGNKIGVYVCHCGGNISDVIDVKKVAEKCAGCGDVVQSKDYVFMCSDPGQNLIIEDIRSGKVDKVVVAACSPALHELTFRKALKRAGLNPYLYDHVNIREQSSWVHKSDKDGATLKAIKLVKAGVAKVALQDSLEEISSKAEPSITVIGGGVAGMHTALAGAGMGLKVILLEKEKALGGKLLELDKLYPDDKKATDVLNPLLEKIKNESLIQVFLNTTIKEIKGFVGNFELILSSGEKFKTGAIMMATGMQSYTPQTGEMEYKSDAKVITLFELQKKLKENHADKKMIYAGKEIKNIAFIHCVGSRQVDGQHAPQADGKINDYCSRLCCTSALHTINKMQERFTELKFFDFYQDIRTYGRGHEELYEKASKNGVTFFRYSAETPPTITQEGVLVKDILTWNEELIVPVDLIVLVTGVLPNPIDDLVSMLKLPRGVDRFLQEAHPKLRPVEIANSGIYLSGACQGPMDVKEATFAAKASVSKASALLAPGFITIEPFVARVCEEKCQACGLCVAECSYTGAIKLEKKAIITPALCKGCGACAAVCPHRAIEVAGWSLDQFDAMVTAIAKEED